MSNATQENYFLIWVQLSYFILFKRPMFFSVKFGHPSVVTLDNFSKLSPSFATHILTSSNKCFPVVVLFIDCIEQAPLSFQSQVLCLVRISTTAPCHMHHCSHPGPRRNMWNPLHCLSTVVPYSLRCLQHAVSLIALTGKHFQTALSCFLSQLSIHSWISEWFAMFSNFIGQYIATSCNSMICWMQFCEKSLLLLQLRMQLFQCTSLCSEDIFLYFSAYFVWKCRDKL